MTNTVTGLLGYEYRTIKDGKVSEWTECESDEMLMHSPKEGGVYEFRPREPVTAYQQRTNDAG